MMNRHRLLVVISITIFLLGSITYCDFSHIQTREQVKLSSLELATDEPIAISSNSDFIARGCSGDGTKENPFILEGLNIKNSSTCISIIDTTAFFVIRHCVFPPSYPIVDPAIHFNNVTNGFVFDCDFDYHYYGVKIDDSSKCWVANSSFVDTINGVHLLRSSECLIEDNSANSNSDGYALYNSVNCTIRRNVGVGSIFEGFITSNSFNCTFEDNYAAGSTRGGYYQWVSDNITYTNNIASRNADMGFYLDQSDYCTVQGNCIREQKDGIVLRLSNNCTLLNNKIYGHSNFGIELRESCEDNLVLLNAIGYNDATNAKDDGIFNRWDDGVAYGNYWDNTDGIVPYLISGLAGSVDNYPLVIGESPPLINNPPDYAYEAGTTGHVLSWNSSSPFPYNYSIYLGSLRIKSGLWYGSQLSINVDSMAVGNYTFQVLVQDFANRTSEDNVTVMVFEAATTSTSTTTTTSSTTTPTTSVTFVTTPTPPYDTRIVPGVLMQILSIGAVLVLLFVVAAVIIHYE